MASYSRQELVDKYKNRFEEFWADKSNNSFAQPLDSTEIQIASVDEMMLAYGYVPRRVASHPNILDGRFGYTLAFPVQVVVRPECISFEDAVSMHNGSLLSAFSSTFVRKFTRLISFAREQRIVEQVSLQRVKKKGAGNGLKSQKSYVKFVEEV